MSSWKSIKKHENTDNAHNEEEELKKENELNEQLKRQLHSLLVSETEYLHHLDTIVKVCSLFPTYTLSFHTTIMTMINNWNDGGDEKEEKEIKRPRDSQNDDWIVSSYLVGSIM